MDWWSLVDSSWKEQRFKRRAEEEKIASERKKIADEASKQLIKTLNDMPYTSSTPTAYEKQQEEEIMKLVQIFLTQGANPNEISKRFIPADHFNPNDYGQTIYKDLNTLGLAAYKNSYHIAKILLEAGALTNHPRMELITPLSLAVLNNNTELVRLLLAHKANPNQIVIDIKNPKFTKDKRGQPLGEYTWWEHQFSDRFPILHFAIRNNSIDIVRLLVENGANPLTLAIQLPDYEKISQYEKDRGGTEVLGRTSLIEASIHDNLSIAHLLIDAVRKMGSDVSAFVNKSDKYNRTALYSAASSKKSHLVELLLQNGANPLISNKWKETPLMQSALFKNLNNIKLIVNSVKALVTELGKAQESYFHLLPKDALGQVSMYFNLADYINQANTDDGDTALINAVWHADDDKEFNNNTLDIVQFLVTHGANVTHKNKKGQTALDLVYRLNTNYQHKDELIKLLTQNFSEDKK